MRQPAIGTLLATAALLGLPPLAARAAAQFVESVDSIHVFVGDAENEGFARVHSIGDIDGDNVADMAITVPTDPEGGTNAGKVTIYSGASGALIRTHVGNTDDVFGYDMKSVGDVSGDGVPDYVVCAPQTSNFMTLFGPGNAFLYSGADGSLLHTWPGADFASGFACRVSGLGNQTEGESGDADGDGVPDLLISSVLAGPGRGRVYLFSGADYTEIYSIAGSLGGDLFGFGVGGLGDVDGDSIPDFVVGALNGGPGDRGQARVFSGVDGTQLSYSPLNPDTSGASFGLFFTNGPGDVDGDGVPDIYVSDFNDGELGVNTGKGYVYSGADGALLHKFVGEAAGEGLGVGRGCGDVDNDGHADLLIASYTSSAGAPSAGKAFVFSGADGSTLRTITCTLENDLFGFSLTGVGDVNRDGALDFAIGALNNDTGFDNAGNVYVIAGDIFPTTVDHDVELVPAGGFALLPSRPNPARDEARISFRLADPARVTLSVFDPSGRLVATLLDEPRSAGLHAVDWDGRDRNGGDVVSGVYFYRLTANRYQQTRRLVLTR